MMPAYSFSDAQISHAANYISDVFRPCVELGDWPDAVLLPFYLQANWIYRLVDLDGRTCVLMWDAFGEQQAAARKLKKMIDSVTEICQLPVIYGVHETSSSNRKRLIDQRIAFVIPGKQLYLPFAALDLREIVPARKAQAIEKVSACAQQVLLLKCLGKWQQMPAQAWAEFLGVSKMTVSRAYRELRDAGIARLNQDGRQVNLHFEMEGRNLWEHALPYLSSPVKRQTTISQSDYKKFHALYQIAHPERSQSERSADEWVLSQLGMLGSPRQMCYVLDKSEWVWFIKLNQVTELDDCDEDTLQIQLWRYDPGTIEGHGQGLNHVDPLSLYLSLQTGKDERVQLALEQLLDQTWEQLKRAI